MMYSLINETLTLLFNEGNKPLWAMLGSNFKLIEEPEDQFSLQT